MGAALTIALNNICKSGVHFTTGSEYLRITGKMPISCPLQKLPKSESLRIGFKNQFAFQQTSQVTVNSIGLEIGTTDNISNSFQSIFHNI